VRGLGEDASMRQRSALNSCQFFQVQLSILTLIARIDFE